MEAKYPRVVEEIMDGVHDADLSLIQGACQARLKNKFRPGMKVILRGTKNPALDGQAGVVLKANAKRISVGVGQKVTEGKGTPWAFDTYEGGEYNVPPAMGEPVGGDQQDSPGRRG